MLMPIQKPSLRKLSCNATKKFLKDREDYFRKARDTPIQGNLITLISLVAHVSTNILTSLIRLNAYKDVISIKEITDGVLLTWLSKKVKCPAMGYACCSQKWSWLPSMEPNCHQLYPWRAD